MTRRQLREADPSVLQPRARRLEETLHMIRPMDDLIYVDPFEVNERVGSIYMPDEMRDETPLAGRVFAVGQGRLRHIHNGDVCCWTRAPMSVEVGDYIFYPMFAATPFQYEIDGVAYQFIILKDGLVFGHIDPSAYPDHQP